MKLDEIESQLRQLEPSGPPDGVKERVLGLERSTAARWPGLVALMVAAMLIGVVEERAFVSRLRASPLLNPSTARGER